MLIFKEVSSRHSGAYTCVANNDAAKANYTAHLMVKGKNCFKGHHNSSTVILNNVVAPQWTVEPHDVSSLLGSNILIDCSANGFPKPQISWLRGKGRFNNFL